MGTYEQALALAMSLPEAWQDHPWEDDLVVKVRKKIFVFFGAGGGAQADAAIGVKLDSSLEACRQFEGTKPSSYGLGKYGWMVVPLAGTVPPDLILDWVEESYRMIAPKTLVRQLDERAGRKAAAGD